jgi:hypothetical protein
MMKQYLHVALLIVLILLSNTVKADFINFDDGVEEDPIGSFYSSLGVNFYNAKWIDGFPGGYVADGDATPPFTIRDISSNGYNSYLDPIVITFDTPQAYVSILGVDVGYAGVRMDAYDSIVGGDLITSVEKTGSTVNGYISLGGWLFSHEERLLEITAPNIIRIELYRPYPVWTTDGVHYDNLTFVPVPGAVILGIFGLSSVGIKLRKHA